MAQERTEAGRDLHSARMAARLSVADIWLGLRNSADPIDVRPWRILDWEHGEGELTPDELRRIWELVSARTTVPRWAD